MSDDRDVIQKRLLNDVDDKYDKSQGQFIYDAEKPVAIELEKAYTRIDGMLDKYFADTATGLNLDRITKAAGIDRKLATKASGVVTITGVAGSKIQKGEKVASDSLSYVFTADSIIPDDGTIDVNVECVEYGSIGNVIAGAIKSFPKTLQGLQTVVNKTAFNNGYDMEEDNGLKERYYSKIKTPATSGNKYHYINWALEVTGVGSAKVYPLWNGNGTVKLVIANSNKRAASKELIDSVSQHIEENRPIGANVTVESVIEKSINITANVQISTAITLDTVQNSFKNVLQEYFENTLNENKISIAKIGSLLLGITGVLDYSILKLNNIDGNINLLDEEIAVLGSVSLGVM